jgi:type II secretory pathway pseudopilin PulG
MPPLENEEQEETGISAEEAVSEGVEAILDGNVNEDGSPILKEQQEGQTEADFEGEGDGTDEAGDGKPAEGDEDETRLGAGDGTEDGAEDKDKPVELDYSMPEGITERAQDRFTKLVDANKEKDTQIEGMTNTLMGMRKMVEDTGMSNQEFIDALDTMRTLKANPQEGIAKLQGYIDEIARQAGIEVQPYEYDALSDFPDLKSDVEDMKISREYALEVAKTRRNQQRQEAHRETKQQQESARRNWESERNAALPKIGEYIDQISKSDIDWDAKSPLMLEAAAYARDNLPPSKWVPYMQQEYNKITKIATKVAGNKGDDNRPLMGNSSVRGGQKEPSDIGGWIDQNL